MNFKKKNEQMTFLNHDHLMPSFCYGWVMTHHFNPFEMAVHLSLDHENSNFFKRKRKLKTCLS